MKSLASGNLKSFGWRSSTVAMVIALLILSLVTVGYGRGVQKGTAPADVKTGIGSGHRKGGTVTIPIVADPTLNPWHPNSYIESLLINRVLFDGLTKPGKNLAPAPDLATSWETSKDGLSWTFQLRSGVTWHDGKPFTADDVAYTFNEIVLRKELGANGSSYFKAVDKVEVTGPQRVVFRLKRPFAALPAYLAYNAGILPKHIFEGKDPWTLTSFNKETPVGTGPFKIGKYTSGQSVELVANPDYFGGAPYLDRLVFKVVADPNSQIAQALSNDLSIMILDNKAAVDRVKGAKNVTVYPVSLTQFYWLALHQTNPLFNDVKVRQAMAYALDRQTMINTIDRGYATVANGPISPALKAYYNPDVIKYKYNVQKAKDLLAQAGWKDTTGDGIVEKDGNPFQFVLDIAKKGNLEAVGQMAQQYLKAIGMNVQLNSMEWNALIQKDIIKRDYDATINWWTYPNDPDVLPYFHSSTVKTGNNIPDFKDPQLDKLLELGQSTSEPAKRKQVYDDLQKYMSNTLPYVFLWYPQELQVRNNNLRGVPDLGLRDALHYVNEWWIKQ